MDEGDGSPRSGGDEMDKSSSTPSDFEVFEYEDIHEPGGEGKNGQFPKEDSNHSYHRRLGTNISDEEDDACGTPLNLELAQLLTQGIVTKAKANFGISKNIETLERSTIELERENSSSDQDHVPTDPDSPGYRSTHRTSSCVTSYKRDPDLYLRRSDDIESGSSDDQQQLHDDEDIDFVQLKKEQFHQRQQHDKDPSVLYGEKDEMVFETHTGCTPGSVGGSGYFHFTEPTTSYHSACGYDSERMMFEALQRHDGIESINSSRQSIAMITPSKGKGNRSINDDS
uniref:Uncharacterized protein n=1 Tax=Anopheles minimus TaxID=112268 RepID=A0A182WPF7_9DIPT